MIYRAVLTALILLGLSSNANAKSEFAREEFGPFIVETERYQRTGPPIMHVPSSWVKVRFIWNTKDGLSSFQLEDTGGKISRAISVDFSGTKGGCHNFGALLVLGPKPSNNDYWLATSQTYQDTISDCEGVPPEQVEEYAQEFGSALEHYTRAMDAYKDASRAAFGSTERCLEFDPFSNFNLHSGPTCARWSGPQLTKTKLREFGERCGISRRELKLVSRVEVEWKPVGENYDIEKYSCLLEAKNPMRGVHIRVIRQRNSR